MDFVDNIDFILPFRGENSRFFAKLADIVDAGIARGVDFDNIKIRIFEFIGEIIDFVRKNPRD